VTEGLAAFSDQEVMDAIRERKHGKGLDKPVKQVELDALLAAPEGFGDDVPVDQNFHARRLPEHVWRRTRRYAGVESVIQVHRLREVLALVGFTRFEAVTPDIQGEYETDVERAQIAIEPTWFPAVENRGEGVFVALRAGAVKDWLARPAVQQRLDDLRAGHRRWMKKRKAEAGRRDRRGRARPEICGSILENGLARVAPPERVLRSARARDGRAARRPARQSGRRG
jgi:hypothetical protein